jgi:CRISPR-associated endonuclease Csn1
VGSNSPVRFVLGLDVGANSVGWAIVRLDDQDQPCGVMKAGARVFEAGLADLEIDAKGKPRNAERRAARMRRRMLERRGRRLSHLFRALQNADLMPQKPAASVAGDSAAARRECARAEAQARHEILTSLDETIASRHMGGEGGNWVGHQVLPYWLRARALDHRLNPDELGRALYHLAQRRGFLSNRKTAGRDKEEGKVKSGISELARRITDSGARTLGEFMSGLDPHQERIRKRWTARQMYLDEFDRIWEAQRAYHSSLLTDEARAKIHHLIFFQRRLKPQSGLVGACSLEPGRKRAPWGLLDAQRFRLLQRVNDLTILHGTDKPRSLSGEERAKLIERLETSGDITFAKLRTLLGVGKSRFNLEEGGEKRLVGNRTSARLRDVFGDHWTDKSREEQAAVVEDLLSVEKEPTLERRAQRVYGLDPVAARAIGEMELEPGYCAYSRAALRRLLPRLESGLPLQSVIMEEYGAVRKPEPVHELLPPVRSALRELRNPVVARCLTEVRKVVNAVVRTYGRPERIRLELARQVKQSAAQRERTWQKNRDNQKERDAAATQVVKEIGIQNPKRSDLERVLLAQECNWICPYTGRSFSMAQLFGGVIDVEHIIPYQRCLDSSFLNKTLCFAEENRAIKRNHTPYEAYSSNLEKWSGILARVHEFRGTGRDAKLRRFTLDAGEVEELLGQFTARQLVDTAYASRSGAKYLGLLYGGEVDEAGIRRVQTAAGGLIADLRGGWGLNAILGDGSRKSRADHRHHAIDAVTVAVTTPALVKAVADAASRATPGRSWLLADLVLPWPTFMDEVREQVGSAVAAHRPSRRIRGCLHEATLYSGPRNEHGRAVEGGKFIHLRRPLDELSKSMISDIVDPVVRQAVADQLVALGGDPKRVFKDAAHHPLYPRPDKEVRIHKVRVKQKERPLKVAEGMRARHVLTGSNHHVEIVADDSRKGRWEGHVVSLLEAHRRIMSGEPVVKRDHEPGKHFLFALSGGDTVELTSADDTRALHVLRGISRLNQGGREYCQLAFVGVNDARLRAEICQGGAMIRKLAGQLQGLNCRKVEVDPLGRTRASK